MKYTTVKISEFTRKELFRIASRLQVGKGRKVTLEDAIKFLIGKNNSHPEFLDEVRRKLRGQDLPAVLSSGRGEDGSRS